MPYEIQDFGVDVIEASHELPIVVDFWAEWCGPCQILGPILEELAAENQGAWRLAKVDTEQFPEEASHYGVRGIPNVKLFVDGAPVDEFVGALPESHVRDWLERALPSEAAKAVRSAIEQARSFADEGQFAEAAEALEDALADSPEDRRLNVELARVVVFEDPGRAWTLLANLDLDIGDQDLVEAMLRLAKLLEAPHEQGDSEEIGVEGRRLEGIEKLRARDFSGALEAFLEVLKHGSGHVREEARKACAAVFHYLGPEHPVVTRFRGEVAGALYR